MVIGCGDKIMNNNDRNMNIDFCKIKYAVVGLGLIGGSIVKALNHRFGALDITAIDNNPGSIKAALEDSNITRGFTYMNDYVWDADLIFLCTPIKYTINYIEQLHNKIKPGTIITDVGSTKEEIIYYVNSLPYPPCFIGGHPMAGSEKAGYEASSPHLFENAYYILTPSKNSGQYSIELMKNLVIEIGGLPLVMDSSIHDRAAAGISHVPHVIASALVNMIKQIDFPDGIMRMLAAGGFKDITRIASSNPGLWQNIALSNKHYIRNILVKFMEELKEFIRYLDLSDSKEILDFFASAKDYRDSFDMRRHGFISPVYEITIDVADKPGVIGKIATILGNNNINIKNINVSNSREFEQGCIIISLPDGKSVDLSLELLNSNGYKAFKR
jgi:prephenate dehydrogenase